MHEQTHTHTPDLTPYAYARQLHAQRIIPYPIMTELAVGWPAPLRSTPRHFPVAAVAHNHIHSTLPTRARPTRRNAISMYECADERTRIMGITVE